MSLPNAMPGRLVFSVKDSMILLLFLPARIVLHWNAIKGGKHCKDLNWKKRRKTNPLQFSTSNNKLGRMRGFVQFILLIQSPSQSKRLKWNLFLSSSSSCSHLLMLLHMSQLSVSFLSLSQSTKHQDALQSHLRFGCINSQNAGFLFWSKLCYKLISIFFKFYFLIQFVKVFNIYLLFLYNSNK